MRAADRALDAGHVDCDGLRVVDAHSGYTVSVAGETHGRLDRRAAHEMLVAHPDYLTNWAYWRDVGGDARRAFLRWIEGADERPVPERYEALREGVSREWGQLRITAELADAGERRYELRHVDDADAPAEALDSYDDPLDARELVETDENGRYRPLKTAPTLARGWRFADLSGAALYRAVDFIYPATVPNWHREREGALDVTHWRAAADRQTGIYSVVSDLSDEQVRWLAEACCVDSQCLKRRKWDLDADEPFDVPRGDGAFPCREPCSLVVAAAREVQKIDAEETRTYTLELTPSEREGLDELLDAVAEGRVDEVREADLDAGANRYRARYLRAKRASLGQDTTSR
ncbi:MAG: DR2241 family protein [Halobacteriaceae archaeon]